MVNLLAKGGKPGGRGKNEEPARAEGERVVNLVGGDGNGERGCLLKNNDENGLGSALGNPRLGFRWQDKWLGSRKGGERKDNHRTMVGCIIIYVPTSLGVTERASE